MPPLPPTSRSTDRPTFAIFGLSLGLLLFELSLTRLLSVVYYYHTAFLAISVAVLGLAAGAQWVALAPRFFAGRERGLTILTACGMTLLPPLFPVVRPPVDRLAELFALDFLLPLALAILALLLPFLTGGCVLALTFQRHRTRVARIYAADLLGASAGTLLLIPAMSLLGGPATLFACGALVALTVPLFGTEKRTGRDFLPLLLLVALTGAQRGLDLFPLTVDVGNEGSRTGAVPRVIFEKWNAFSRVAAIEHDGWDRGLSEESLAAWEDRLPQQIDALIDINAFAPFLAFDGDLETVAHLDEAISNLGHHLLPTGQSVAILGPGGGKDVLGALRFAPRRVLGIEINPIIAEDLAQDRLRAFCGDIYNRPGVELVVGDARGELERRDEDFDLIIANSVATWAAQGSGAMTLTEQHLFTREAFALWRDRLDDDGILSVSLWDGPGHFLALRLLETWRAVTGDDGLAERAAVIGNFWAGPTWFTNVLLSRRPFNDEQRATLTRFANDLGFDPLYVPAASPFPETPFARYLEAPGEFIARSSRDLATPTDDRPFFFFTRHPVDALTGDDGETNENRALKSLVASFLILTLLVAGLLFVPLLVHRRRASGLVAREATYFGSLGAAYLLIEIGLIQRLTLPLGHPTHALTVVLFGLLAWSGLGSRLSAHFGDQGLRHLRTTLSLLPLVLIASLFLTPHVLSLPLLSTSTPLRILAAFLLLAPLGLLMGIPFPTALRLLPERRGAPLAHAFGINGATGVLASVAALLLAILAGYTATFLAGIAAYVLALLSRPRA